MLKEQIEGASIGARCRYNRYSLVFCYSLSGCVDAAGDRLFEQRNDNSDTHVRRDGELDIVGDGDAWDGLIGRRSGGGHIHLGRSDERHNPVIH